MTPPTPSLHLSMSPSACMVAGQLPGELSFPGTQLGMTRHGVGGEDEGANAPSPCPPFWGHKWSPVPRIIHHLLISPLSCVPLPVLPSLCPQSKVVVWHRGRCISRLTNCCHARRAKPVGERDIVLESASPLVPTAVCQPGI